MPQRYIDEIEKFKISSTVDCSVYRDMPLVLQLANIAVSRSVGCYLQEQGKKVYTNVRWGDERTYTNKLFDIPPAFAGVPKHSIVCIGSYGCIQSKEDKYYFEAGLAAMLEELEPIHVLDYGNYNPKIFSQYEKYTQFHFLPDWITQKRR